MESQDLEKTAVPSELQEPQSHQDKRTAILIIDNNAAVCEPLTDLIQQQPDSVVSAHTGDLTEVLKTLEKKHIDFAIVNIYPTVKTFSKLVEEIKLQYPNLPILMLSFNDNSPFNQIRSQTKQKIVSAINYVQSLLRSRVYGFTVFIEIGD